MVACIYCEQETGGSIASCDACRSKIGQKKIEAGNVLRSTSAGVTQHKPAIKALVLKIACGWGLIFSIYCMGFASFGPGWALSSASKAYAKCNLRVKSISKEALAAVPVSAKTLDPVYLVFSTLGVAICDQGKKACDESSTGAACVKFIEVMQKI